MKIVVLSDTHIPRRAKALPESLLRELADTGHIIHAGDITTPEVLETLAAYAPVTAVAGNADPPELKAELGEKAQVVLDGFRFGIYHGHGAAGRTLERSLAAFPGEAVDAVIFGHSHNPYLSYHGGVLLFNPGSPTDRRRNPYCSFGVIETGDGLSARIVYFDREGTELLTR